MSRWGKNIVVPLDSLCKEKENTNRPTVARSVGTVGKWGKMGFTSTRTYALTALPAAVAAAAAAAAAAASPAQSPASLLDDDMSPSVPEPPKPKKFFKSRNSAPPEVIAQIIQHLPRTSTSPSRDSVTSGMPGYLSTPVHGREPIKLKINKSNSAERKKKTPKKSIKSFKQSAPATGEDVDESAVALKSPAEPKPKKKKEEKKLKPEAAPSRVIARARKTVNYYEEEEDERAPTPLRDIVQPKSKPEDDVVVAQPVENNAESIPPPAEPELPPPATPCAPPPTTNIMGAAASVTVASAPKTPEHPPIVLRISKGTSRLVSTDSEELQPTNAAAASPSTQQSDTEPTKSRHASTEEVPPTTSAVVVASTPKIIVKPPKQHSPEPPPPPTPATTTSALLNESNESEDDPPEINYCTVKISPDKPPKERLKLIIKTDVIRNAIAAAAAAAAAKAAASAEKAALAAASSIAGEGESQRPEKERKQKSKKHKHPKHAVVEQLTTPAHTATAGSEFKTPSPHLALGASVDQPQRTVISPPALSERDFDSQSSVLGSISSKGNSTPQPLAQTVLEESCVIHSRGSSVITSDLETSQHSSLVAPPSDIESRLESMMMDGGDICPRTNVTTNNLLAEEEPLQEDILAVLRGDESETGEVALATENVKVNGTTEKEESDSAEKEREGEEKASKRRPTRGRGRVVTKTNYAETEEDDVTPEPATPQKTTPAASRTRGRKPAVPANASLPAVEEPATPTSAPALKRATRRGAKKTEENAMEVDVPTPEKDSPNKSEEENTPTQLPTTVPTARRGRSTRNTANNNNLSNTNNNNNINKIAANLTAKAGAAVEEAKTSANTTSPTAAAGSTPRSYGRKRKNQQVTHVVQPSAEELEEQHLQDLPTPAKMASIDLPHASTDTAADTPPNSTAVLPNRQTPTTLLLDLHDDANSNSNSNSFTRAARSTTPTSPPRRDYKIKDKFKRTLMLDNQVNCNAVVTGASASPTEAAPHEEEPPQQQRGSVKLVITKKKGSIFKSRALVPSESEQSSAATKRHLYKHRWDAEANGGGTNSDGNKGSSKAKSNEAQAQAAATRSTADDIFDDFSEDLSAGAHSRDNSPLLAKLTRFTKPNPQATGSGAGPSNHPFDMDIDGEPSEITGVRIDRKAKEYYTVVRNVKTAHQIQEIGEYQEMDDDVEYILDALQPHNPTPTRCLSALQLATKCMTPAFRMHVRAHGVVTKFFKALSDSNKDLSLGLCTSAIMYILSQEGLNMDLDRDSLELMMNLLEAEGVAAPSDRANYERNQQKVRELCEEIKAQGKATHLNVDSITVGTLAMETLLSLTSKRAGEWFKEELRELGGLEHIIKTISDCCRPIIESSTDAASSSITWTQSLLDNMQTVERCMRVLENVTQMNEENQKYMLTYANGTAVNTLCTLYRLCDRELMLHPTTEFVHGKDQPGIVMRELLMPVMKVLINLTHTFNPTQSIGAELLGKRSDVLDTSLHLLLQAPNYIPDRCVFELSILVLLLFINLTMHTTQNRMSIMKAYAAPADFSSEDPQKKPTAVQAVMEYFYKCEELARLVEKNTDAILDNTDKNKKKQEEVDETVNNLLQKAGHHMEHTLKGSYAGILIGHLITDNEQFEATVRLHLRGNGFKEIVSVLEKYHTFMNLTASSEASVVAHIKSTKKLIDYFKKRDLVYEMNESNDDCALPLNLETHHQHATTTTTTTPTDASATSNTPTTATRSTQRVYKTYSQR